jgi:hypothetical protein
MVVCMDTKLKLARRLARWIAMRLARWIARSTEYQLLRCQIG